MTGLDEELASKERRQILNEALQPPTVQDNATEELQEKVKSWIQTSEGQGVKEWPPAYSFQVCSQSLEDYPPSLELTPPGQGAGGGVRPPAAMGPELKQTTMGGVVIKRDFQSKDSNLISIKLGTEVQVTGLSNSSYRVFERIASIELKRDHTGGHS